MKQIMMGLMLAAGLLTACASNQPVASTEPEPAREGRKMLQTAMDRYHRGCDAVALEYFEQAHELFSLADQVDQVAVCLNNMGNIYRRKGRAEEALLFFDQAARLFRQTDNPAGVAQVLSNQAATLLENGHDQAAGPILAEAAALAPADSLLTARIMNHRAILLMRQKQYQQAEKTLNQAADLVPSRDDPAWATINASLGHLMQQTGRHEQARTFFNQACRSDLVNGNYPGLADDLAALAESSIALEQFDRGLDYLERSAKLYALTGQSANARGQLEKMTRLAENRRDLTLIKHFLEKWLQGEAALEYCR
ncbi:MAG: tetratricopeptide repeat protein [Desulfosudaceae bacterium]